MKVIYTTLTAIRKIKDEAKSLQRSDGFQKSAALDRAAQDAGYENYHHARASLQATEKRRHPFAAAWAAIENATASSTQAAFFAMHDRLHALLVGEASSSQLEIEANFMRELAARPDCVPIVTNWLGSFLSMPSDSGFLALVFVQHLHEERYPVGNLVTNVAQIEAQIQKATGVQVLLSNTAMLAYPKEPSFTAMTEVLGSQLMFVMERLNSGAAPTLPASPATEIVEMPGTSYVIPGWVHVPSGDLRNAADRLLAPMPSGSVVDFAGNGKPFSAPVQRLGTGESLFSAWYPEHVLRTFGLLMDARDAGTKWGSAEIDVMVARPDGEGMHEIAVQVTVGEQKFAARMPPVSWPVYLFLALDSTLRHAAARVSYQFSG